MILGCAAQSKYTYFLTLRQFQHILQCGYEELPTAGTARSLQAALTAASGSFAIDFNRDKFRSHICNASIHKK